MKVPAQLCRPYVAALALLFVCWSTLFLGVVTILMIPALLAGCAVAIWRKRRGCTCDACYAQSAVSISCPLDRFLLWLGVA